MDFFLVDCAASEVVAGDDIVASRKINMTAVVGVHDETTLIVKDYLVDDGPDEVWIAVHCRIHDWRGDTAHEIITLAYSFEAVFEVERVNDAVVVDPRDEFSPPVRERVFCDLLPALTHSLTPVVA